MRAIAWITAFFTIGPVPVIAGSAPPDFSGVYYPVVGPPPAPPGARPGGEPPPAQTAPLNDGSQGRPPNLPPLTEPYLARWDLVARSRAAGSSEFDVAANCLPPGMPFM